MKNPSLDPWCPELLAGYADGELGAHDRQTVEAHLAAHPEVRVELEAQQKLVRKSELWNQLATPSLSDTAWNEVANRIRAELHLKTDPAPNYRASDLDKSLSPRLNAWRRMTAGVAVTAAIGIMAFGFIFHNPLPIGPGTTPSVDALAVATDTEVDYISIKGLGDNALVVGQRLLAGPLDVVAIGDMVVDAIDRNLDSVGDGKEMKPRLVPHDHNKTQPVP